MPEPVRLSNGRQLRRPLLWGGLALVLGGVLVALSSWLLPEVFEEMKATTIAQIGSGVLALLGVGIIGYALVRHVLWVEFGDRIRVRWAFSERGIEWEEVASLGLDEEETVIRPLAGLFGVLPQPLGVVAKFSGAANLGEFNLTFRRLCLRLTQGDVIRCDVRVLQWEAVEELARSRSVPLSAG